MGWAADEFREVDLGDRRLDSRLVKLCDSFSESPESPINQACADRAETKAAYRFFQNENVDVEGRALSCFTVTLYCSIQFLCNQVIHNMQSQPCTYLLVGGVKRLKYMFKVSCCNSLPRVFIFNLQLAITYFSGDVDIALFIFIKSMDQAVQNQVGNDLGKGTRVTIQFNLLLNIKVDLYLSVFQFGIQASDYILGI